MRQASYSRSRSPALPTQADVPHTFWPLLVPFALMLLATGGIQLERALANPLEADSSTVIFGAVLLAWGILLGVYLLKPKRNALAPPTVVLERVTASAHVDSRAFTRPQILPRPDLPPLPFHRFYKDAARISR